MDQREPLGEMINYCVDCIDNGDALDSDKLNSEIVEWNEHSKYFSLTAEGLKYVEDNLAFLQYLFKNSFEYDSAIELSSKVFTSKKTKKILIYDEDDTITEGKVSTKTAIVKERSQKLRRAAIEHYIGKESRLC